MQEADRPRLIQDVSRARYERFARRDPDFARWLACYNWNLELAQSFYPILQHIEVSLRNRLHDAIGQVRKSDAWIMADRNWLKDEQARDIAKANDQIRREKHTPDEDRYIAALDFGFWTSFLNSPYDVPLWQGKITMTYAFPFLDREYRDIKRLRAHFWHVRTFRNKVFHHEPLFHRHDLLGRRQELLRTLRWLSKTLYQSVKDDDAFTQLYKDGCKRFLR